MRTKLNPKHECPGSSVTTFVGASRMTVPWFYLVSMPKHDKTTLCKYNSVPANQHIDAKIYWLEQSLAA